MYSAAIFDVVIVYSEKDAHSAAEASYHGDFPFLQQNTFLNAPYSFFLSECKKQGLVAGLATTADITGPRLLKSIWVFEKNWKRKLFSVRPRMVFDKFLPVSRLSKQKRVMLERGHPTLFFTKNKDSRLFTDKLAIFRFFPRLGIPTVVVSKPTKQGLLQAKRKLDRLLLRYEKRDSFGKSYVLKDRLGLEGLWVFKIDFQKKLDSILQKLRKDHAQNPERLFVLQPFVLFNHSRLLGKQSGHTDLRVLCLDKKIVQAYVRTAKKGDFRCNVSQGGTIRYLNVKHLPAQIKQLVVRLANDCFRQPFFSLDFIQGNSGRLFLVEANASPGLYWDQTNRKDQRNTRQMIRQIVQSLKRKISRQSGR